MMFDDTMKIYAAAADNNHTFGDDEDQDNDVFEEDDEEEVTMTSDDDEGEIDDADESGDAEDFRGKHAEDASILAPLPISGTPYDPATKESVQPVRNEA